MRAKFAPDVYVALKDAGMSNREIAKHLGVNEASVRRALPKSAKSRRAPSEQKFLVTVTPVD